MVTPDDSRWDDPEALDGEYAEDVALEEDGFDPDAYVDPTDRGDGTKTADPNYGQTRRGGDGIALQPDWKRRHTRWRQWERKLRSPSDARPPRLTGPERDLLSKNTDEIAAEIHEAGQQLRKARTPETNAKASERFVQLLDDLWRVELDPDAPPITDGVVTRQAVSWSDQDAFIVRDVSRHLVEHLGWNQAPVRHSRKSHASPEKRTRVLCLYAASRARGLSERETCRIIKALTGVSRTNVQRWRVAHFAEKVPNPQYVRGETMSEVQTLADARADHEERLQDLERWVGLPVGGRKEAEAAVDRWIAESLSESTHESEDSPAAR